MLRELRRCMCFNQNSSSFLKSEHFLMFIFESQCFIAVIMVFIARVRRLTTEPKTKRMEIKLPTVLATCLAVT